MAVQTVQVSDDQILDALRSSQHGLSSWQITQHILGADAAIYEDQRIVVLRALKRLRKAGSVRLLLDDMVWQAVAR